MVSTTPGTVTIGDRAVGAGQPCFVIAEAGVNHNGDVDMALELVRAAARAGADAVKFQTFVAERLVTADAAKARYQAEHTGAEETQAAMLKRLELTPGMHHAVIEECARAGLMFFSTPFDEQSADFLESLDLPVFKIPSGEVTNLPYLAHIAAKRRPMILSTGMSNLAEVARAVETIERAGPAPLAILHCLSAYPAPGEQANLRAMQTIRDAFARPTGFSDHTVGTAVALAAVAMGANLIEKHYTLDRTLPGPDHAASLEPDELARMVADIRLVEAAQGDGIKRPQPVEAEIAAVARKSLIAARDIAAGEVIVREALIAKRPGTGISPADLHWVVGRTARRALPADTVLSTDDLA